MILFPVLFTFSLTLVFLFFTAGLREAFVKSYIGLFFLICLSTELLSAFGAVTYGALSALWGGATVACILLLSVLIMSHEIPFLVKTPLHIGAGEGVYEAICVSIIVSILSVTLVVAVLFPPNNYDSMTYHMPRVAAWIQQASIEFYPTSIDRQNYQPPLAEFAILHLQLLSKSDRFANIVQWYSFFMSIVLATLIAKELQLPRKAQLASSVFVATLPMGILQSSGTQNDLVASAFSLSFAYFLLTFTRTSSSGNALFCALALGFALLTKGTNYLYCCAIGVAIGIKALFATSSPKRLAFMGKLVAIVLAALLLNVGHFSRNFSLYGNPLSTAGDYRNEELSAAVIVSNVVRNAALHLETVFHRMDSYSFRAAKIVLGEHLNNPKTTMSSTEETREPLHEDYAGNVLHFVLGTVAFLIFSLTKTSKHSLMYPYAWALILSIALYSVLLKWQPWASRLHTPIFMLSAPFIAANLVYLQSMSHRFLLFVAIALFAYSVPFLLLNKTRPLAAAGGDFVLNETGRLRSYFINRMDLYDDYVAAANVIRATHATDVGLCFRYDDYEYPLWVLVGREASRGTPRLRHVGVVDVSRVLTDLDAPPPALVVETKRLDGDITKGKNLIRGQDRRVLASCLPRRYTVIFDSTNVRIWRLMPA